MFTRSPEQLWRVMRRKTSANSLVWENVLQNVSNLSCQGNFTGAMFGVNENLERQMQSMTRRLAAVGQPSQSEGKVYMVWAGGSGRSNRFPGSTRICHGWFRQCLRAIDRRATPQPAVGGGQSSQLGEGGGCSSTLGRGGQVGTKKGLTRETNIISKGKSHNLCFYQSNLIFWIVMWCGIACFGRRGL